MANRAAGRSPASSNSSPTRSPAKAVNRAADSRAVKNNRTAKFVTWRVFLSPANGAFFFSSVPQPLKLRNAPNAPQFSSASRLAAGAFGFS